MLNTLIFVPIFNLVIALYRLFGENLGFAIIVLAILSRAIALPMMSSQMNAAKKMRDMKPKLDELKKRYDHDKQKLSEEQLKLYKEMGINPFGGCIPMIIQLVFLIQVRNVVVALVTDGLSAFNKIAYFDFLKFPDSAHVNLNFLGMDLSKVASNFSWSDSAIIPYVVLALLVGLTQLLSTKILMQNNVMAPDNSGDKGKKDEKRKGDNQELSVENFTKSMNTQMTYMFPALTIFMSLGYSGGSSFFSAALSLFWTVQNLFVIIQNIFSKPEILQNLLEKFKKINFIKKDK